MMIHLEHSSVMNFGVPLNSVATHCVLGGGMGKHLFKHVNSSVDVYNTQHGLTFAALCQLVEKGHSINHSAEGVGTQYCNFLKHKSIVDINGNLELCTVHCTLLDCPVVEFCLNSFMFLLG